MIHVCLLKTSEPDAVFVLADEGGVVVGFETAEDGLAYWTDESFARAVARGHVGAMSALVFTVQFSPVIASLDLTKLKELVEVDADDDIHTFSVRGEAGGFTGLRLREAGVAAWEQGRRPQIGRG